MLIKKRPSWAMAEADATSEHIYLNRREWLRAAGFAGLGLTTALTGVGGFAAAAVAAIEGYPAPRHGWSQLTAWLKLKCSLMPKI